MAQHRTSPTVSSAARNPAPSRLGTSGGSRRASVGRRVLAGVCSVLIMLSAGAYWALDRYVVDHVEIGDVAAHEAAAAADPAPAPAPAQAPVASSASATPGATAATDIRPPVVTATTYTSDTASIKISTVVTGSGADRVTYYVADVQLADATRLRGGFADNKFGRNIVADTSAIAKSYDAVFAVNGDYYGFRDSGILIRNGVLYRDTGARTGLAIYRDGTMALYDETTTTGAKLLADGVWNTLSFGPGLLANGEIVKGIDSVEVDTNFGNHSIQGRQPRTGIGVVTPNHFVFVAADGRSTGYSRGVTMTEFAQIFKDLGATVAYNLDGGGSTTMYFNGALVNNPLGKGDERGISDILYIA